MGNVVDMTGREIAAGEEVTRDRDEQFRSAAFRDMWQAAPDMVRYLADEQEMPYADAAFAIVHSLLREAEQAAENHEVARQLLVTIGEEFFGLSDAQAE